MGVHEDRIENTHFHMETGRSLRQSIVSGGYHTVKSTRACGRHGIMVNCLRGTALISTTVSRERNLAVQAHPE